MTVYAITDTKKGRTGIAPILIFKLPHDSYRACVDVNYRILTNFIRQ